ncbi:hypothetical protein F4804DRAFT_156074 [Jackrogersella minutella]|nr:hypothetical protein F4804DRAFT_156074 [Jackrogersella minutella]
MAKSVRPDSSMEEMWRDATVRFNKRTGMNVNVKPPKTINDCVRELEQSRFQKEPHERTGKETFEEYGLNILRCLKLLGGVAAQGAEMVFGAPSSICFNALYLLLDIPEQFKSFREAIDGLLETLGPSLSVFRIYERMDQFNDIEPELRQAIHEVMISFVDICALSIELRDSGKWRKFKSRMKLLITHDDSGIQAEMERFEKLTQSHHSIQSTQTLKVVLDTRSDLTEYLNGESERSQQIASDVASLKAADDKRNSEDTRHKHVQNIKKKFGIEDALYKSFEDMCDKPRRDCAPNTALWFMEHPEFRRWAERDDKESNPLFILTGAPNSGKSVILSSMVHYLRSKYESPTRYSTRTLIAAHFFPNTTAKDDRDKRPIATALKCIAIQLADQDGAYAKSLSQSCDTKSEDASFFRDASCQELWDFLRIGSPKGNTAHYLVLDGLSGLPDETLDNKEQKEQLLKTMCNSVHSSVRVLFSARRDTVHTKDLPSHVNSDLEQYNGPDIQRYIEHYLRFIDILQDPEDDALRMKVLHTLAKQVGGNFNKAKAALENIREVVASDGLETDIDKVLDESNMNEKQITQTVISQLEEKLTGEEIDELNELLIWVICGRSFFSIDQLSAALVLRFKRRGTLRLRKKLEGKYSNILKIIRDGRVTVTADMDDTLTKRRDKPRSVDDTPTFTATITIAKGDLRSVQSFMWSLSQKVDSLAHNTFGFEQIAEQNGVKNNIQVNEVDGNLTLVRRTFILLAGEPSKESKVLGDYLLNYLPQHLEDLWEKAIGYDELTPSQKQEIGEGLFSLFVSGEAVERHWNSCQSLIWYRDPLEILFFRRWLDDATATSRLGRLDRDWLKKIKVDPNPNKALLVNIMRTVAWHWLCDREWDAVKAFSWLQGFCLMPPPSPPSPPRGVMHTEDYNSDTDGSDGLHRRATVEYVVEWCKGVHPITTDEAKALMNERLGETYLGEGEFSKAIAAYNTSISLIDTSWKCIEGLAKALAGNKQYEEACQEMDKALKILSNEDNPDKDALLSTNYSRLAEWQIGLEKLERAIEYAEQAIELTPSEHRPQFELLKIYLDNNFIEDAVKLLSNFVKAESIHSGPSLLGLIINDILSEGRPATMFGMCFNVLSEKPETFTGLIHQIDLAINQELREMFFIKAASLLLYKGVAIYRYGLEEATRVQQAMQCWERCISLEIYPAAWNNSQVSASSWMCAYYFDQAMRSRSSNSSSPDVYLRKMNDLVVSGPQLSNIVSRTYLASYYARFAQDVSKAQRILQVHIDSAFDTLSDDVEDNDGDGYYQLAEVLVYCGDELNALHAFFLPLPLFPTLSNGQVMSWILESESSVENSLGNELLATVVENCAGTSIEDQLQFLIKHIEHVMNADSDGIDDLSAAQATTPSNLTDTVTDGSIKETHDQEARDIYSKVERKAAYESIRIRLDQWSHAYACGAKRWCDVCSKMWDLENPMNHCRYCYNIDFCDECLNKLKIDKLKIWSLKTQCHKDHDWLRLPNWDKEAYMRAFRKEVYIGEPVDDGGERVGATVTPASEWLDGLKKKWGAKEEPSK